MARGDGSHFTAEISSSIYGDSEGRQYSSMIVRDITERLRSQAELEGAAPSAATERQGIPSTGRHGYAVRDGHALRLGGT